MAEIRFAKINGDEWRYSLMYGRYEFKDGSSDKFWEIEETSTGMVRASWGKNGRPPQAYKDYSQAEARSKLNEKISKGYRKVGSPKSPIDSRAPKSKPKAPKLIDFLDELKKI